MKILTGDLILQETHTFFTRPRDLHSSYANIGLIITGTTHYVYQATKDLIERREIQDVVENAPHNATISHLCLDHQFTPAARIKAKIYTEEAYDSELKIPCPSFRKALFKRGALPFNPKLYRNWVFILGAWITAGILPRYINVPKLEDVLDFLGGTKTVLTTHKGY